MAIESVIATCRGRAAADPFVLTAGDVVDGLVILAPRARGGFAQLYEARSPCGRRVAVKLLLPELTMMRKAAERLRLEASVLTELAHPHIVEIVGCGEFRRSPYLALEWIDGPSLADHLAHDGALPLTTTLAMFRQICGALATAHSHGIIHRDLKAHNVMMVGGDPVAIKLVDFGIAKVLGRAGPGITTSMQVLGSPLAISPEQLLAKPIDERTDVYALGVLLFHCLTGRPPFLGASVVDTEELHLFAEPPRLSEFISAPRALDDVVRRAMAKPPTARHPDVATFLADLEGAVRGDGASRRGAAVYVEVDTGTTSDDVDALDRALLETQQQLGAVGLARLAEASNALLVGATMPGDGGRLIRNAITTALALARPRMRVALRIMIDEMSGDRSSLGPAAVAGLMPGVYITRRAAVLADVCVEPVVGHPQIARICDG